jgi:hypothetical protein
MLVTSGEMDLLKIWDLERESFVQEIATGSDFSVTCMVCEKKKETKSIDETNEMELIVIFATEF